MRKKPTITQLKKKAWKLCSEYIRRRDSDSNGMCRCITCGNLAHWKEQQAGHFIDGRTNAILFDERGIYAQCTACNIFGRGKPLDYMRALEGMLGQNEALNLRDDLMGRKKKALQFKSYELEELIEEYKIKIKHIIAVKGDV